MRYIASFALSISFGALASFAQIPALPNPASPDLTAETVSKAIALLARVNVPAAAQSLASVPAAQAAQVQTYLVNQAVALYEQNQPAQALPIYKILAQQGNATAEYALGIMYQNGWGVSIDYGQAMSWYQESAAQGYANAESNLAFMYATGLGVTVDYAQAMSWYQKAAAQGFPEAEYGVGYLYDNGDGVPVDHAKAVVYFQQAAAQGYASAIQVLANLNGSTVNTQTAQASSPSSSDADQAHRDWQDKVDDLTQQLQQAQQDYNDDQALANNQKAQMQQETSSGGLLGALQGAISAVGDAGFQQRADQAKAQVASLRAQLAQLNAAQPAVNTSVSSFANGLIQQSNQPNLVQQTANQQQANILAAGNNQFVPQPYTPPQPTPASQPAYQPPIGTPSAAAPSTGCVSLISQVAVSSAWKTGLGSMPNEVVVTATNNASVPVTCSFHYHKAGAWDAAHGEQIDLAPGQTLAGEAAGLWYQNADSSQVNYACYQKNSTTPQGGACSALPF